MYSRTSSDIDAANSAIHECKKISGEFAMPKRANRSEAHSFIALQLAIFCKILIEIVRKSTSSKAHWMASLSSTKCSISITASRSPKSKQEEKRNLNNFIVSRCDRRTTANIYYTLSSFAVQFEKQLALHSHWMWCVAAVKIDIYTLAPSRPTRRSHSPFHSALSFRPDM